MAQICGSKPKDCSHRNDSLLTELSRHFNVRDLAGVVLIPPIPIASQVAFVLIGNWLGQVARIPMSLAYGVSPFPSMVCANARVSA